IATNGRNPRGRRNGVLGVVEWRRACMAEHETGVLTAEQRATFRSAGFWMAIVGWAQVLLGAVVGLASMFAALREFRERGIELWEWRNPALLVIASECVGILTLIAARSFRRAGRAPAAGLPEVTAAVTDLAELYERQVWLAFALLAIAIGSIIAKWW